MTKRPYGDKVLLKAPDLEEDKVNIELLEQTQKAVDAEKRKAMSYEVVALGTDMSKGSQLKVGDRVYWQGQGTEMEFDGEVFLLIREYDILVID